MRRNVSFVIAAAFAEPTLAGCKVGPHMEFPEIFHPDQLWVLTELLQSHCEAANIKPGTQEYEAERARIVALYENGARTIYELLAGLDADRR
jgi:hypothetical protein